MLSIQGEEMELYQDLDYPSWMTSHPYSLPPRRKRYPDFMLNILLLFLCFTLNEYTYKHKLNYIANVVTCIFNFLN